MDGKEFAAKLFGESGVSADPFGARADTEADQSRAIVNMVHGYNGGDSTGTVDVEPGTPDWERLRSLTEGVTTGTAPEPEGPVYSDDPAEAHNQMVLDQLGIRRDAR